MTVTLEEAKAHCQATGYADDDALLTRLVEAATDHLRSLDVDVTADPLPPAIKHAALLLVGTWYSERGANAPAPGAGVVPGVDRLIAPYRSVSL